MPFSFQSSANEPKTRDRKCESCGKEFRTELPWIKHMNELHKGEPGIHIPGKVLAANIENHLDYFFTVIFVLCKWKV